MSQNNNGTIRRSTFKKRNRSFAGVLAMTLMLATVSVPVQQVVATSSSSQSAADDTAKVVQASEPRLYEQRSFSIEGRGNVDEYAKMQNRTPWSKFNPTGIYVKPGETIKVTVSDVSNFAAYIHDHEARTYRNWYQDVFELKKGENTLHSPSGGVLYFSNENPTGSIEVSVEGGHFMPIFEKGVHTNQDWEKMLKKYPDVPYVELVSDYVLITALYDSGKQYATDPEGLLPQIDLALDAQYQIAGYDDASANTVHRRDRHYHHMTEHFDAAYMFAAGSHTGYARGGPMQHVLNTKEFTNNGWGPWHELGHTQQQQSWKFKEMTEVQVNIFSLASWFALGNPPRLDPKAPDAGHVAEYNRMISYLNRPSHEKDYVELRDEGGGYDHFVKLGMLWQLQLGLGENFYPHLHRAIRELPVDQRPDNEEDKKGFFMVMASKSAGRNLLPFFDQWGLRPTDATRKEIAALNLPILEKPIWESTDTNPVREEVTIVLDSDSLHMPGDHNGNNHPPINKPNSKPSDRPTSKPNTKPNSKPSQNPNSKPSDSSPKDSSDLLGVSIQFSNNQVQFRMPMSLHRGKFRVVAFHNGTYIGESYENTVYYSLIDRSNKDHVVIFPQGVSLKKGDKIEVYLMEDKPGYVLNKTNAQLLASATY